MCLVCVELAKNKLTSSEARRNLRELSLVLGDRLTDEEAEHLKEVTQKIEYQETLEKASSM